MKRRSVLIVAAICLAVLLFGLFRVLCGLLVEYWWFRSLGFESVFTRILFTKIWLWWLGFALAFGATAFGFVVARRVSGPALAPRQQWGQWSVPPTVARKVISALCWSGAVVVGLIGGSAAVPLWHHVLLFLNRVPFGTADPVFANDIGFYVFVYPLAVYVRGMLLALTCASLAAACFYYVVSGAFAVTRFALLPSRVFSHLSRTVGVVFLLVAVGYFLDRYSLLYSRSGVSYGAGYTDVYARLPACWLMVAASAVVAVVFLTIGSPRGLKVVLASVLAWLALMVLAGGMYPGLLRYFRVAPNELRLEEPYIKRTVAATLAAYKLDDVQTVQYPVDENLSYQDFVGEDLTIKNVRVWDWRPLRDTYRQIQGLRAYYDFNDVDVDRYDLERGYTQTLLSLRELTPDKLPTTAKTWINLRLQYTHGYGLCLSPVNEQTQEGLPVLMVRDIPPVGPPELALERPQIYYGQSTADYVFGNTRTKEFDYPLGDTDVRAHYEGRGGVPIGGIWRKLVFALQFHDAKILLATDLVPGSRVLFHRHISERVRKVAPYLMLDDDPYPVIYEGGILWIQDAYTVTRLYPYSEPSARGRFNYIRNAVKVVIDAYHGDMTFYVADEEDPLVQTYSRAFPGVYVPMSDMPEGLRKHVRYPENLFNIQAEKYAIFHMQDPNVFYNKEDPWDVAQEQYRGQEQRVESYYIFMRLPESDRAEFIVMLPFTPTGRHNMIAWLAGRCDGEQYGRLVAYVFPKGKLIAGPFQVEGWIDQDPEISQQLTLWGQGGSSVIRGNLLVIPIANGILYVEPLYIRAEAGAIPQLKRVITAYGKRVAMAPTFEESLRALFAERPARAEAPAPVPEPGAPAVEAPGLDSKAQDLLRDALNHYERAQEALREADWQSYGLHMRELKASLDALDAMLAAE